VTSAVFMWEPDRNNNKNNNNNNNTLLCIYVHLSGILHKCCVCRLEQFTTISSSFRLKTKIVKKIVKNSKKVSIVANRIHHWLQCYLLIHLLTYLVRHCDSSTVTLIVKFFRYQQWNTNNNLYNNSLSIPFCKWTTELK